MRGIIDLYYREDLSGKWHTIIIERKKSDGTYRGYDYLIGADEMVEIFRGYESYLRAKVTTNGYIRENHLMIDDRDERMDALNAYWAGPVPEEEGNEEG